MARTSWVKGTSIYRRKRTRDYRDRWTGQTGKSVASLRRSSPKEIQHSHLFGKESEARKKGKKFRETEKRRRLRRLKKR